MAPQIHCKQQATIRIAQAAASTLLALALSLAPLLARAETYIYRSAAANPLFDTPPLSSGADAITLEFTVPARLAPNSVYDISVAPGPTVTEGWQASDSLFGIVLTGAGAPIALVPAPGLIEGGALTFCDTSAAPCFGGAIQTDAAGRVTRWNLVADGAPGQPYLTFITYNTPGLGGIDGLGSVQSGLDELELNTLNGPVGAWTAVPEPTSWALPLVGFAGLGAVLRAARARRPAGR